MATDDCQDVDVTFFHQPEDGFQQKDDGLSFLLIDCKHRRQHESSRFKQAYRIFNIQCHNGWHLQTQFHDPLHHHLLVTGSNTKVSKLPISAVVIVAGHPSQPILRLGRRGLKRDDNTCLSKAIVDLAIARRVQSHGHQTRKTEPACPFTVEGLKRCDIHSLTMEMLKRYPLKLASEYYNATICEDNLFVVPFQIVVTVEHETLGIKEVLSDVFHVKRANMKIDQDSDFISEYATARGLTPISESNENEAGVYVTDSDHTSDFKMETEEDFTQFPTSDHTDEFCQDMPTCILSLCEELNLVDISGVYQPVGQEERHQEVWMQQDQGDQFISAPIDAPFDFISNDIIFDDCLVDDIVFDKDLPSFASGLGDPTHFLFEDLN